MSHKAIAGTEKANDIDDTEISFQCQRSFLSSRQFSAIPQSVLVQEICHAHVTLRRCNEGDETSFVYFWNELMLGEIHFRNRISQSLP